MKIFRSSGMFVAGLLIALSHPVTLSASSPAAADYLIDHGAARITTTGEHMVTIAFEGNADRGVRHVFHVGFAPVMPSLNIRLSSVAVEYRGSEIVLMDAREQVFYRFAVTGHEADVRAPRGFSTVSYAAVGVSHTIHPMSANPDGQASLVDDCSDCNSGPDQPDYGWDASGGTKPSCSQGGEGSTSCSVEAVGFSCSVSCASGYYACCSVSKGCKCYRN
jgi:hypothetical protein